MNVRESGSSIDPWSRVSVVVVTHNSAEVIEKCLLSIARANHVIVVDNASDDSTLDIVCRVLPKAEIIHNMVGLGFGNASNQGLERVKTEFALHPNPDTVMKEAALESLIKAADQYPDGGLFGPKVLNPKGKIDLSYDAPLHLRGGMPRDRSHETLPEGSMCTGFLSGAVLLYRMSALQEVGMYDPVFFLYYEDMDLCARFFASPYNLIYTPNAEAVHVGGGSIRPNLASHWEKFYHMAWSRLYYEDKYNHTGSSTGLGLRSILKFGLKGLAYTLVLQFTKAIRDFARASGSLSYLLHIPASKTTRRTRPNQSCM